MPTKPAFKQPETALMVACARLNMQPANVAAAAEAMDRRPNWSLFVRAAREHGIVALAQKHLQGAPVASKVPADVQEQLREETLAQARRNLKLTQELLALHQLFAREEIAVVSLKGPILAQQIYGSIALRRISDLDFLVRESDVLRTVTALKDRGYVSVAPDMRDADEVRSHATHELQPMVSKKLGCVIDLHHALVPPVWGERCGFDEVLIRTQTTSFMGRDFLTLGPEELFVYLCEHGNGHLWNRLEWICSIAEMLRSGQIKDWNRVTEFANRLGGRKRLETAIRVAHELLDAPPAFLTKRSVSLASRAIHRYAEDLGSVRTPTASELFQYQLATDAGLFARFDRVWKMAVLPRNSDIETLPLPRAFWWLYYFLRPFLIVRRVSRRGS